jgi:hypothetical protein
VQRLVVFCFFLVYCGNQENRQLDDSVLSPASANNQTAIYVDSLANGWNLDSWGWSSQGKETSSPAEGAKALQATMTSGWGAFSLAHLTASGGQSPIQAGTYSALDFDINPGAVVSPAMATLALTIENNSGDFALKPFVEGSLVAGAWTHVHVPLATVNKKEAAFFRFDFLNESSTSGFSFYLDNIVLTSASATTSGGSSPGSSSGSTSGSTAGTSSGSTSGSTSSGTSSGSTAGSSSGASSGSTAGSSSGASSGSSTGGSTGSTSGSTPGEPSAPTAPPGHESWVWPYMNWQASLTAIASNKTSFTHVSPTFYSVNYNYQSGVAYYSTCGSGSLSGHNCADAGTNYFDGLTTKQVTQQITAAGLATVPAIYGGAANGGTDQGVQNLLNNTNGAATSFITAMVQEAVTNGYAGYNIDWEVGSATGSAYADKLVTFVNNFKAALAPHGMSLSFDVVVSNINGTWCSSNNGLVDFAKISASSLDRLIIEDYTSSLGTASNACQSAVLSASAPITCPLNAAGSDVTATGLFNFMCSNMAADKIVIGLESYSNGTNPIAGPVFTAMSGYGFTKVAVWPQTESGYPFLSGQGFVGTKANWYAQLAAFLIE